MDKQHQDFKAYKAGKASRRNQRQIMTALNLTPDGPSSEELDEDKWKSKNTFWLGDDMTSLGQFRPSYLDEASTSQVPPVSLPEAMHVDPSGGDDQDGHDDEDDSDNDDEGDSQDGQDDEDYMG